MKFQLFLQKSSLYLLVFLLSLNIPPSLTDLVAYNSCKNLFSCGNITVNSPFWGGPRPPICGQPDLQIGCEDGQTPTIVINRVKYNVLAINEKSQILRISRADFQQDGICEPKFFNTTMLDPLLQYPSNFEFDMITIYYGCPQPPESMAGRFSCLNANDVFVNKGAHGPGGCNTSVVVPIKRTWISRGIMEGYYTLRQSLREGFEVKWHVTGLDCGDCIKSNGSCGYDIQWNLRVCHCLNEQFGLSTGCRASQGSSGYPKKSSISWILISAGATTVAIILIVCIVLIVQRRKLKLDKVSFFSGKQSPDDQKVEDFVRSYGSLCPQRYSFNDIKKMTRLFCSKLGEGGFGDVYRGELQDGRRVAVKLLKESKGDGEEFINEVASISKTSHINVVTFLGFCFEQKKRALVYEFMPNGSLNKYIYDHESSMPISANRLGWKTMCKIGVGIARGLEYLHRGCNTRIVHFDIKPHNILLDEDFCPKIADFGLSKLCRKKESTISLLGGRGTPGYIAPEVFCRNFGEVSHKSDVYSYGMMIIEMVVGRKSMEARGSQASEIYFADWIYKYTEPGHELHGVITEEEKKMAKKMILVSLWCIQAFPSDRPPMSKVVEMLEGKLEDLQIPTKPNLSSAATSIIHSSQTSASASDFHSRGGSFIKVGGSTSAVVP